MILMVKNFVFFLINEYIHHPLETIFYLRTNTMCIGIIKNTIDMNYIIVVFTINIKCILYIKCIFVLQ